MRGREEGLGYKEKKKGVPYGVRIQKDRNDESGVRALI